MVEVKFKIPEWAFGRHIYIFAGQELLGMKESSVDHVDGKHVTSYKPLLLKPGDGRCNGCGECCKMLSDKDSFLLRTVKECLETFDFDSGLCPFITDEGCALKSFTPFSCLRSICTHIEGCSERLEVAE